MNKFNQLYKTIMEDNVAGPGGAFGDAPSMGHGGNVGNDDFYARGDARNLFGVPKKGKKKKKIPIQRRSIYVGEGVEDIKAPKKQESEYDQAELKMGTDVEKEHTEDVAIAKRIAMNHLDEDPKYYTKLKKVESGH